MRLPRANMRKEESDGQQRVRTLKYHHTTSIFQLPIPQTDQKGRQDFFSDRLQHATRLDPHTSSLALGKGSAQSISHHRILRLGQRQKLLGLSQLQPLWTLDFHPFTHSLVRQRPQLCGLPEATTYPPGSHQLIERGLEMALWSGRL